MTTKDTETKSTGNAGVSDEELAAREEKRQAEIEAAEKAKNPEEGQANLKAIDHETAAKTERDAAKDQAKRGKQPSNRAGGDTGSGVDLHNDNDDYPAGVARGPDIDSSFPVIEFDDPVVDGQHGSNPGKDQVPLKGGKRGGRATGG